MVEEVSVFHYIDIMTIMEEMNKMLKDTLRKLIDLKSISGKNDKKDYLKINESDKEFMSALRFLLDDFVLTGISKKKLNKKLKYPIEDVGWIGGLSQFIEYIEDNNTGKDNDIATIQQFILRATNKSELSDDEVKVLKELVTKKLKLGVSAKSFNKVFPSNEIKTFNVMLAKKYQDHIDKVEGKEFTLTRKLDGIRCVLIKEKGKTKAYSRSGKLITGIEHITSELNNLFVDDVMLDGELLNDSDILSSDDNFRETQSKALSKSADKSNLKFHCFDGMPVQLFYRGGSPMKHINRLEDVSSYIKNLDNIKMVNVLYQGYDTRKISEWMEYATEQGWEGIMISLNEPYVCKRTHYLLKVKKMHSCDLKVLGFQEGTGKFEDTLGALVVDYKSNELGVGSGFDDEMRDEIWNNKDKYIDKIVEVQYFEESKDKEGKLSLRFPVFKGFRLDKDEESYN